MDDLGRSDQVFSRVARRYELLNRILSFGGDHRWRQQASQYLPPGLTLDLGSGTGSAASALSPRPTVGLDPVLPMLDLSALSWRVLGRGENLPFADNKFDGVFSSYTFRNLDSVESTLSEIERVLVPGGKAVIVDLGRPPHRSWAKLHRVGTALTLPLVGCLALAPREYWYLHRSLDKLPPPEQLYANCGLRLEKVWRMGFLDFVYGAVLTKSDDE